MYRCYSLSNTKQNNKTEHWLSPHQVQARETFFRCFSLFRCSCLLCSPVNDFWQTRHSMLCLSSTVIDGLEFFRSCCLTKFKSSVFNVFKASTFLRCFSLCSCSLILWAPVKVFWQTLQHNSPVICFSRLSDLVFCGADADISTFLLCFSLFICSCWLCSPVNGFWQTSQKRSLTAFLFSFSWLGVELFRSTSFFSTEGLKSSFFVAKLICWNFRSKLSVVRLN